MALINKSADANKKRFLKKPLNTVFIISAFIIILLVGVFIIYQNSLGHKKAFTYDIPALIGKNIDQADRELGMPIGSTLEPPNNQSEPGGTKWHRIYMKNKHALIVNFNSITRKVISFVLDGDNKETTLDIGNLSENDSKYKV